MDIEIGHKDTDTKDSEEIFQISWYFNKLFHFHFFNIIKEMNTREFDGQCLSEFTKVCDLES